MRAFPLYPFSSMSLLRPFLCFFVLGLPGLLAAQPGPEPTPFPDGEVPCASAVLIEASTGEVLFGHNERELRAPASTIKTLLELVVLEAVEAGEVSWEDEITVSRRAQDMGGSQVYLATGEVFTLRELMAAISIASANDACVAVAEHVAGSAEGMVARMNALTFALGLTDTYCINVHGLDAPEGETNNRTTALDLARVARELVQYPELLEFSSTRLRPFRDGEFMLYNTNKMLGKYPGMDGLKTGYTSRAGFNLIATAERDGMRLISVVMGCETKEERYEATGRLLDFGFGFFEKAVLFEKGELVGTVAVEEGHAEQVFLATAEGQTVLLPRGAARNLRRELDLPKSVPAPVREGQVIGLLRVYAGDELLAQTDLRTTEPVEALTFWDKVKRWF